MTDLLGAIRSITNDATVAMITLYEQCGLPNLGFSKKDYNESYRGAAEELIHQAKVAIFNKKERWNA